MRFLPVVCAVHRGTKRQEFLGLSVMGTSGDHIVFCRRALGCTVLYVSFHTCGKLENAAQMVFFHILCLKINIKYKSAPKHIPVRRQDIGTSNTFRIVNWHTGIVSLHLEFCPNCNPYLLARRSSYERLTLETCSRATDFL